jgi:hypothetical protein
MRRAAIIPAADTLGIITAFQIAAETNYFFFFAAFFAGAFLAAFFAALAIWCRPSVVALTARDSHAASRLTSRQWHFGEFQACSQTNFDGW